MVTLVNMGLWFNSWQDLKDHMRRAGDCCYASVDHRNREGVVEFTSKDDMFQAIQKMDRTEFRNPFDTRIIRVRLPRDSRFRSSSRYAVDLLHCS